MCIISRVWNGSIPEPNSGCWIWLGAVYRSGRAHEYGVFSLNNRRKSVHRAAFEAVNGPVANGQVVRHRCDNSLCVNPDHLVAGTQAENVRDMFARGRSHHQFDPSINVQAALNANETMARFPQLRARGDNHGKKGNGDKGEKNSQAKLTDADVIAIRSASGISQRELARMFGVHQGVIWRILKNKRWAHLTAASLRARAQGEG